MCAREIERVHVRLGTLVCLLWVWKGEGCVSVSVISEWEPGGVRFRLISSEQ